MSLVLIRVLFFNPSVQNSRGDILITLLKHIAEMSTAKGRIPLGELHVLETNWQPDRDRSISCLATQKSCDQVGN